MAEATQERRLLTVGSSAMLAWPDVGQRETSSPQRQIPYLAFPLPFNAAFSQQENLFNGATDGQVATDFKYTRHRLALLDALVRVPGDGGDIVREEHPPFLRGPCQHRWVVCPRQAYILEADKVQSGLTPEQPPHNVAVEILVGGQQEHGYCPRLARRANNRSRTPCGSKRPSFCCRTVSRCLWRCCKYTSTSAVCRK